MSCETPAAPKCAGSNPLEQTAEAFSIQEQRRWARPTLATLRFWSLRWARMSDEDGKE